MTGKISHLSREIRHELSLRLERGHTGKALVHWLNQLPEVQAVLAAHFGGRPINDVNLSEWKAREYRHWRARRDILGEALEMSATASELSSATDGRLSDNVATLLSARYLAALNGWDGEFTDQFVAKLRNLGALTRDISELRRADHRLARRDQLERQHTQSQHELLDSLKQLAAKIPASE